jgi:hypothetical protein
MDRAARLDLQEHSLDALLTVLGLGTATEPDPRVDRLARFEPLYPQYHRIGHKRQTAYRALAADRTLARRHADAVYAALVHDDDPSSPRWLTSVLLTAVGRRHLQERLLGTVADGTPYQRACAAGGWRWSDPSPEAGTRFRGACAAAAVDCIDPWARERLTAAAHPDGTRPDAAHPDGARH